MEYIMDKAKARFYKSKIPKIGEMVMVLVTSLDYNNGIYVKLLEYDGQEGFASISELTKAQVKSRKNIAPGKEIPLVVTGIDGTKKYVDLSSRKKDNDELIKFEEEYSFVKKLYQLGYDVYQFYSKFIKTKDDNELLEKVLDATIWNVYEAKGDKSYKEIYNTLLVNPEKLFEGKKAYDLFPLPFVQYVTDNIKSRVKYTPGRVEVDVTLLVISDNGLSTLQSILTEGITFNEEQTIEIISPPTYRVCVEDNNMKIALERVTGIVQQLDKNCKKFNCTNKVGTVKESRQPVIHIDPFKTADMDNLLKLSEN